MAVAKAKVEKEVEVKSEFVEVEHFAGLGNSTFFGPGFRVEFVDGKALVPEAQVKFLKEAGVIK